MIRHYIRIVALALIIFPEPVTTALGIAILTATLAMPGGRKALSKFKNMEDLLNRSFKDEEKDKLVCFAKKKTAVLHRLEASRLSLQNQSRHKLEKPLNIQTAVTAGTQQHALAAPAVASQYKDVCEINSPVCLAGGWFDNRRVSARVWHHTLQNSQAQFESSPAVVKKSGRRVNNRETEPGVELHTLKTDTLPRLENSPKTQAADCWKKHFFTPDEVVFHTLKTRGLKA
jgi:hypothetical protein